MMSSPFMHFRNHTSKEKSDRELETVCIELLKLDGWLPGSMPCQGLPAPAKRPIFSSLVSFRLRQLVEKASILKLLRSPGRYPGLDFFFDAPRVQYRFGEAQPAPPTLPGGGFWLSCAFRQSTQNYRIIQPGGAASSGACSAPLKNSIRHLSCSFDKRWLKMGNRRLAASKGFKEDANKKEK